MSSEMLQEWDKKIQDAKNLLAKVEAKATRLREAIATFKSEKESAESAIASPSA
jgi:hypothetical protein